MNKKVFVFDMDGTLLNSHNQLMPATIKILNKLKKTEHIVIIATGRPYLDAIRDLEDVLDKIDYLICNNGAYFVHVNTKKFTRKTTLPYEIAQKISQIVQNHNSIFTIHGDEEARRTKLGNLEIDWNDKHYKGLERFEDEIVSMETILEWAKNQKIAQVSLNDVDNIFKSLETEFKNLSDQIDWHFSSGAFLDINLKNTNKAITLEDIITLEGLTLDDAVAFGDSGNDLQMLAKCGLGFCMENGTNEAKAMANETIGSHNSDAISLKINEIVGGL